MKEIELPDGSIAEFPDDMDDSAIQNVLSQQFKPTPQRQVSPATSAFVGGANAAMLNFGDEITDAVIRKADELAASRNPVASYLGKRLGGGTPTEGTAGQMVKQAESQNPRAYMAGEVGGSLLSPSPAGKLKGTAKLSTIAAEGGLNALGSSEDKSLTDFVLGAATSAGVSKGLEGVSRFFGPARNSARDWLKKQADTLKTRQIMGGGDVSSMRKLGAFDPDFQERINEIIPDRMMWRSPDYRQKYLTDTMDQLSLKKAGDIAKIKPGVGVTPRSMLGAGEQAREGLKMNISRDIQLPGTKFKDTVRTSSLDPAANRPFTRYEKFITEATPLEQRMIQTESGATVPKMFSKQDEPIPVSEVDKILSNVQRQSRWSKAGQDSAGERSWKGISNKLRQTVEEDLRKTGDPSVQDYLATRNKMFSAATAMDANKYALEKEGNKSIFGLLTPMEGISTAISAGTAIPLIAARRYGNAFGSAATRGGQKALELDPRILDAISLGIDKGLKRPASYFSSKRD